MRVTNSQNDRFVLVRINDRGPFTRGRVIDLTPAAARVLGFSGLARVRILRRGGYAIGRITLFMRNTLFRDA